MKRTIVKVRIPHLIRMKALRDAGLTYNAIAAVMVLDHPELKGLDGDRVRRHMREKMGVPPVLCGRSKLGLRNFKGKVPA